MRWLIVCILVLFMVGGVLGVLFMGRPLKIEPDLTLPFDLPEPVRQALYHGALAPSSHNAQMWQVWADAKRSRLYIVLDEERMLPQVDPQGREAYISLGAFVENLRQSLMMSGYLVQVSIESETNVIPNSRDVIVVDYQLQEAVVTHAERENVFSARHSDKRVFLDQPLEPDTVRALVELEPEQVFYFARNERGHEYLRSNGLLAYEQQMGDLGKRDELAQWFRFSDDEAMNTADGLPAEQLGLSGVKKVLYYLFVDRPAALEDGFVQQGLDIFRKQLDGSAGFFVITGRNGPQEWIKTGMLMQSFWLSATNRQIALHPFSQMLEEEPFKSQIQGDLQLELPVQMIFRAGYVDNYGQNHGIRRPLSAFVFAVMS